MEILLIACMLAYVAGAQSEQSKIGLSPAQRDVMKENTRHEKAVQRIADKHGVKPSGSRKAGIAPWKEPPDTDDGIPDTFMSGYRSHRPVRRPFGHRVGAGAGAGVTWVQDSTRDAWHAYQEKRRKAEHDNPKPVMVPVPPTHPPNAPPLPDKPPTVGTVDDPAKARKPDADEKPAVKPQTTAEPGEVAKPDEATEAKPDLIKPEPEGAAEAKPETPAAEPEPAAPEPTDTPAATPGGIGRMAAEVSYESVMDESDELSIMCDDDLHTYDRIRERAEREIGRGDALMAAMDDTGFGQKVIAWVARCTEIYKVILGGVTDLQQNTIGQREAVVKAKTLLEVGQGVYAGIAADMESVADRQAYISDAVDAEDTSAHSEVYETQAVA